MSFRMRMPSATSLGLPGKSRVTLVPWRWLLMRLIGRWLGCRSFGVVFWGR